MKLLSAAYAKVIHVGIRNAKQIAAAALAVLLLCIPVFSQGQQGVIRGGVFDQTGGAIVGATVTVIDVARGISRPFTTDSAGQYVALNLIPGTYTVRAEAKGFQTLEHANILVEVGQTIGVDLTLQPGAQTQTITVTEAPAALDTTDAVMGGTVTNQQVSALPINGRDYKKMLALRPGTVYQLGTGEGNGTSDNIGFNGIKMSDNLYLVDGLSEMTPDSGAPLLGGDSAILSVDAIQEMNIEINPKAEYGWHEGGVVDIGLKSGSNSLHGTAFAFGRDSDLDASNYFSGLTPLSMEQFGADVGGPILKDKLFWFASYEGLRQLVGFSNVPTIPSDVALSTTTANAGLSMVNACNALPSGRASVNPLSALMAGLPAGSCTPQPASSTFENVFPFNSSTSTGFNPGLLNTAAPDQGMFKIDYHMSDHNHFSGMYYINRELSVSNGSALGSNLIISPQWSLDNPTGASMFSATWTWTPNATWVNEAHGGRVSDYTKRHPADDALPSLPWPAGYDMPTGVTNPLYGSMPTIQISPFSGQLGPGSYSGVKGPQGEWNFVDHVSYLHGKHAIMFGAEMMRQIFVGDSFKNAQGTLKFANLESFLEGDPKSGNIFIGDAALNAWDWDYAGFVQDDWRMTNRLTLNLGLRYEYYTPPKEENNYLGNFYPNVNPLTTPALGQAGGPFPPLYPPDKTMFSPRFGMAWDVTGSGKTVVRAAISLLYNIIPIGDAIDTSPFGVNVPSIGYNTSGTAINANTPSNFAFTPAQLAAGWNTTGPIFPGSAPTVVNGITYTGVTCTALNATVNGVPNSGSPCTTIANDPNEKAPRYAEWNMDVQHAITNNLTLDVAFVGNHGYDELSRNDENQPPFGYGWNTPSASTGGMTPAAYCVASAPVYNHCLTGTGNVMGAVAANEVVGQPYYGAFPYLSYITNQANDWYSDYDGLQITATERASHGLNFLASFTHDRMIDFQDGNGWGSPYSQDVRNVRVDFGPGGLDVKNHFTFTTTYNVPGIKVPGQMLQGWIVNAIFVAQGGIPWNPQDQTSDIQGTGEYADPTSPSSQYWNFTGPAKPFTTSGKNIPCFGNLPGCTAYVGGMPPAVCTSAAVMPYAGNAQLQGLALAALTNLGCYVEGTSVLTPPAFGTIGNAYRGIFHTPPFYNIDFSVFKDWKFKERYTAEFRAEFFNLLNRADFAIPKLIDPESGLGFGCTCQTPDASQGDPVFGAGGARDVQLGLKLIF